jgi:hypothetical protein
MSHGSHELNTAARLQKVIAKVAQLPTTSFRVVAKNQLLNTFWHQLFFM